MFWKTDLLVKTGGEFTLIWLLAHDKANKKAALNAAITDLDISAKCEALLKYQPTGKLNAEEVRNKMSLYLLAVLQHGIVIAFARKTDLVLRKLVEAWKFFQPLQNKKVTKRKSEVIGGKTKRGRRNTMAALQTPDEVEEEQQLIDLRNLPAEPVSDRFRVQDIRQITLNEYDEQPQGFFEPDVRDLQHMMQFDPEQLSEASREVADNIFSRPGSHAASVNEEMQSLFAELVDGMDMDMIALDPLQRNLTRNTDGFESNYLELRNDTDQQLPMEPMEIDQPQAFSNGLAVLDPSLQLPALNEDEIMSEISADRSVEPVVQRRRRIRNLIVDERTELTDAQVRRNLENTRDICLARRIPANVIKPPTARDLLAPVTHFLPYRIEERYEVPAVVEPREEPMEEFERLELPPPELDFQEPAVDITRPESAAEIARRSSNIPFRALEQSQELAPMDINQVDQVEQPPRVTMDQTQFYEPSREELSQVIEQQDQVQNLLPLPPSDENLLRRINASKHGRERTEFMDFADRTSKTTLARDFVNLLHLLKRRVVRVEQNVAYGPINVETDE